MGQSDARENERERTRERERERGGGGAERESDSFQEYPRRDEGRNDSDLAGRRRRAGRWRPPRGGGVPGTSPLVGGSYGRH